MPKIVYKPKRFGAAAIAVIQRANSVLEEYAAMGYDMTLRQVYYQCVARGWIANRQSEYKRLGSILNDARLAGLIDWHYMVDRTRNLATNSHWDEPASIIDAAASSYANDLWADQDYYVEGWVEKEALAGVIERACSALDVPWFSCRGYVSQTEMWGAARRYLRALQDDKAVVILHLGDHDPSGIDMTRDVQERIAHFLCVDHFGYEPEDGPEAVDYLGLDFEVRRLALNMDQVRELSPPENPTKLSDSRASGYVAKFGYSSWELDALPPDMLGRLIEEEVATLRDDERWNAAKAKQEHDRELLTAVSERWDEVSEFLA
jgi:hypothetical protein